jgi:hypothetical protein
VEAGVVGRLMAARRWTAVLLVALLLAIPARVLAESALWTLVVSPLAVSTGTQTDFSLTATNEDPLASVLSSSEIGCVIVDLPASFEVASARVTGSSAGGSWAASLAGNRVTVQAQSGGDRLEALDWVALTVRATAVSSGSIAWGARAYRQQDCSGIGTLVNLPPVVVVSGPTVTPSPTPAATPSPTPAPTALSTPTPRPVTSSPRPLPTASPIPSTPPESSPAAQPSGTSSATRTAAPAATDPTLSSPAVVAAESLSPSSSAPPVGVPGGVTGGGGSSLPGPELPRQLSIHVGEPVAGSWQSHIDTPLVLATDGFTWLVPAAVLGVPGLLVLAWIGLQAAAVLLWLPAIRRLRREREAPSVRAPG